MSVEVSSNSQVTEKKGEVILEKVVDKIQRCIDNKQTFFSFEYFPPKTATGFANLFSRMERMARFRPLFLDVSCSSVPSAKKTNHGALELAAAAQNVLGTEVILHLTCANKTEAQIKTELDRAQTVGIKNILAIRGDNVKETSAFQNTIQLVQYIRANYGSTFCVCVAGYPEGHPESKSPEEEMTHLKQKIQAGADFIMSQIFYDPQAFLRWRDACVLAGITCPIIPGVMPIQSYDFLEKLTSRINCQFPEDVKAEIMANKFDDSRIKQIGIRLCVAMCRTLLNNGVPGLHLYSLNLERSIAQILEGLGLATSVMGGTMPWVQSPTPARQAESVRPIYWANRPLSYLDRTSSWDEFPNGRWGDSSSPAFNPCATHHLVSFALGTEDERRKNWGRPATPKDVFAVFAQYIDGKVPRLPWCETPVQLETDPLKEKLMNLNNHGFLTINSQPRVNGASSSDPMVGWGGTGGYVYQKAYLEFFTSHSNLQKLAEHAKSHPSISYDAANAQGHLIRSESFGSDVNALTWGVFPNKEIIQPTVADHKSFLIWKDEAFALWHSHWRSIYRPDDVAYELLTHIQETYYLVTVVDNDYVRGDLFAFMEALL